MGIYGAVLWSVALISPSPASRRWAHHLLGFGSIVMVGLQAFVLHQYCAWCLAHALIAWLAWPGLSVTTRPIHIAAGLALALGGHVVQRVYVASHLPVQAVQDLGALRSASLDWLGPVNGDSPVLVMSLRCVSCWDRWLEPLGSRAWRPRSGAPQLLWKTEPEDREMTALVVAAVLSRKGAHSDAFAAVLALAKGRRDSLVNRPESARAWLAETFPEASAHLDEARAILDRQAAALSAADLKAAPLWIERGLPPSADSAFDTDIPEGRGEPEKVK
jgi:hypothetical protein